MALKGGIRYNTQNMRGIQWSQDVKILHDGLACLVAPLRSLHGCNIQRSMDTNYSLRDTARNLVGWMRFDQKDAFPVADVRCVVIGEHVYPRHGWATSNENGAAWKEYANAAWYDDMLPGNVYYVLLVLKSAGKQADEYGRIGVGVIRDVHLNMSGIRARII
jgi:hypothetical protein